MPIKGDIIINPLSGRRVHIGSKTWRKLVKDGVLDKQYCTYSIAQPKFEMEENLELEPQKTYTMQYDDQHQLNIRKEDKSESSDEYITDEEEEEEYKSESSDEDISNEGVMESYIEPQPKSKPIRIPTRKPTRKQYAKEENDSDEDINNFLNTLTDEDINELYEHYNKSKSRKG